MALSAADVASRLAERCDEDGLPYAIGGALALGAWGVPRATADVDIAVFVPDTDLARVVSAVERAGVRVDSDDAGKRVAATGMFVGSFGRMRVDVFLSCHPMHEEMAHRRRQVLAPDGKQRWFLSPEDVALTKLIYGRPKDVIDLERLFAVQRGLDVGYVRSWLGRIVQAGDAKHALLDDLERRFLRD